MSMDASVLISCSPEKVFAYVANIDNDIYWRSGVTESGLRSEPPVGVGSIGYAGNGKLETVYRVTTFEQDRVDWEFIEGPFLGAGGYRIEPEGDGTRFTLVADVRPSGLMKLMGPIFSRIGQRQNQADVEKLREILEGNAP